MLASPGLFDPPRPRPSDGLGRCHTALGCSGKTLSTPKSRLGARTRGSLWGQVWGQLRSDSVPVAGTSIPVGRNEIAPHETQLNEQLPPQPASLSRSRFDGSASKLTTRMPSIALIGKPDAPVRPVAERLVLGPPAAAQRVARGRAAAARLRILQRDVAEDGIGPVLRDGQHR